ncbi:MAG: aldo/keto reductase [Roseibium sp.]|uniref:aldo/keto reductase n=1 Tax=Roseibium sp. TaxID=1936156 RepID=UPI003D9C0E59
MLGRTGLEVGVAGLGCGGHSRLGQSYGQSFDQSVALVRTAIDAGVTLIDTAAAYGTEEIVGEAVSSCRDEIVLSTKLGIVTPGTSPLGTDYLGGEDFVRLVENCLRRLKTDRIDILHLHGVMPGQYAYCRSELVPALLKLREQGKIRFLGLTERFIHDTRHEMLQTALQDDHWDVVMTGFNFLNPSARKSVLPMAQEKRVGTLVMFAVRRALGSHAAAEEIVRALIATGEIDPDTVDLENPLGFLLTPAVSSTIIEAAYRFCRHEPGLDVVLTGTGSRDHLRENLDALAQPALPSSVLERLEGIFGNVDSVSGN